MESKSLLVREFDNLYSDVVRWPWTAKYDGLDLDEVMTGADLDEPGQNLWKRWVLSFDRNVDLEKRFVLFYQHFKVAAYLALLCGNLLCLRIPFYEQNHQSVNQYVESAKCQSKWVAAQRRLLRDSDI